MDKIKSEGTHFFFETSCGNTVHISLVIQKCLKMTVLQLITILSRVNTSLCFVRHGFLISEDLFVYSFNI